MSTLDTETLLQPISPEDPCGPDLEMDPAFSDLERAAQGKEETQWSAAEEPNWREVRERCTDLLGRTKHLRLSLLLATAELQEQGLLGARDGLCFVAELLERFWDTLHPKLDPDDDNDPTERINIISSLIAPPGTLGDPLKFQQRLREVPLCESRQLGRFTLRDVLVARGEAAPADPEAEPPSMSVIQAAFEDTDPEMLYASRDAAAEAINAVRRIEQVLTDRAGAQHAISLDPCVKLLEEQRQAIEGYVGGSAAGDVEADGEAGASPVEEPGQVTAAAPGEIRSREDILLTLDRICDYYRTHEPSSPVPLLLRRARKLVHKNFLEIVEDLTPSALDEMRVLGGVSDEEHAEDNGD